jgi:hypothetical protein
MRSSLATIRTRALAALIPPPRLVWTNCGAIGADARPNWQERASAIFFGRSA